MFKNFLLKQLVKRQMKDMPESEQEAILTMIEKNPDLFMKVAKEVDEKVKGGMNQQQAMMMVTKAHEKELKDAMGTK
jgi:hypothetical protein